MTAQGKTEGRHPG